MTDRMCFQLQVRPDRIEEYRDRHLAVWPDMLHALRETGWRNYSLFLRDDGMVIGYFEAEDVDRAVAAMERTTANARWQAEMAHLFEEHEDTAGGGLKRLTEVFQLEEQLYASEGADGSVSR